MKRLIMVLTSILLLSIIMVSLPSNFAEAKCKTSPITWNEPYQKDGFTYYPGIVSTSMANTTIAWKVDEAGSKVLVYTVNASSAKFLPQEARLYLLRSKNGERTSLFRERIDPNGAPPLLELLAVVATCELEKVIQ